MSAASMDGGADTARVGASEADQAARQARRKDARGNLAAIMFEGWSVDVVAENQQPRASLRAKACVQTEQVRLLLDMLGLDAAREAS